MPHRTPLVHERVVFYAPFIVLFMRVPRCIALFCTGLRTSPVLFLIWPPYLGDRRLCFPVFLVGHHDHHHRVVWLFPSCRRRRHHDHHHHSVLPSPPFRDVACVLGSIFICPFVSRRYVSVLRVVGDVVLVERVGVVPCELSHCAGRFPCQCVLWLCQVHVLCVARVSGLCEC